MAWIGVLAITVAVLPSLSFPVGFTSGLPIGPQLIGRRWMESGACSLGAAYQGVTQWHLKRPEG